MNSSISSPPSSLPPITGVSSTENTAGNSVKNIFHGILSYNDNIMLAAVISLLLVILFVLLLHIYAKWFLTHSRHVSSSVAVPRRRLHAFHVDSTFPDSPEKWGLERSAISAIPLFAYDGKGDGEDGMECIICLSCFESGDVGRKLPKCGHAFHAECIEMWLYSHCSCPVCRAPVVRGGHATSVLGGGSDGGVEGRSGAVVTPLEVVVEVAPKRDTENRMATAAAVEEEDSLTVSSSLSPSSSTAG